MKEQWKDIPGYVGHYQASNLGRIRSLKKGKKIMKLCDRGRGYLSVDLCLVGIRTSRNVHSLIMESFVGLPPKGFEVSHGEGGRSDNSLRNLSYKTHAANELDKRRDGTHGGRCVIRSDGVVFINIGKAAESVGKHRTSISHCLSGRKKRIGGFGWKYKN